MGAHRGSDVQGTIGVEGGRSGVVSIREKAGRPSSSLTIVQVMLAALPGLTGVHVYFIQYSHMDGYGDKECIQHAELYQSGYLI